MIAFKTPAHISVHLRQMPTCSQRDSGTPTHALCFKINIPMAQYVDLHMNYVFLLGMQYDADLGPVI